MRAADDACVRASLKITHCQEMQRLLFVVRFVDSFVGLSLSFIFLGPLLALERISAFLPSADRTHARTHARTHEKRRKSTLCQAWPARLGRQRTGERRNSIQSSLDDGNSHVLKLAIEQPRPSRLISLTHGTRAHNASFVCRVADTAVVDGTDLTLLSPRKWPALTLASLHRRTLSLFTKVFLCETLEFFFVGLC